jgi:uncharacterized protein YgbK (DUF1537 family)
MNSASDVTIAQIEHIRADNNRLWMNVLRIAMDFAPALTKEVIKQINANDKKISSLLERLS